MKTRRLSTILTSAYLSAMLASSVAPLGRSILAAPISPAGAQAAFDETIGRVDASWIAASAPTPAPAVQTVAITAPAKDPVMTEELMARIIKYGRGIQGTQTMSGDICKVFGRCDGKGPLPIKSVSSDIDGHNVAIPADITNKDIYIVIYLTQTTSRGYLTDNTGNLRAAASFENGVWHLITNEQGAAGFKAEMTQFAKEASALPPANGTAVASTSNG